SAENATVMLASVGVGITPLLPMLAAALSQSPPRQVFFAHGARDGRSHSFRIEVGALVAAHPNVLSRICYSTPGQNAVEGRDFHVRGRIDANSLLDFKAGPDADYLLCGPAQFIAGIR